MKMLKPTTSSISSRQHGSLGNSVCRKKKENKKQKSKVQNKEASGLRKLSKGLRARYE